MVRHGTLFRLAAAVAGLYAVTGVLGLIHDQPTVFADPIDYWIEGAFAGALALSVMVFASLARVGTPGRARAAGWTLAAGGHAALLVAALATAIEGREALDALFPLGFLAIVAGYATLAVLDLRKRLRPSRAGFVLLIGFIGAAVVSGVVGALLDSGGDGGTGGGLVLAASWAALARLISETMEPSPLRQASPGRAASAP